MTAAHHHETKSDSSDGNDESRDHSYSVCGDDEQFDSSSGDHGDGDNCGIKSERRAERQIQVDGDREKDGRHGSREHQRFEIRRENRRDDSRTRHQCWTRTGERR